MSLSFFVCFAPSLPIKTTYNPDRTDCYLQMAVKMLHLLHPLDADADDGGDYRASTIYKVRYAQTHTASSTVVAVAQVLLS